MSSSNHESPRQSQRPEQQQQRQQQQEQESSPSPPSQDLTASSLTIPSDSEAYSSLSPRSTSPPRPEPSQRTNDNPSNSNSNNNNNANRSKTGSGRENRDVVIYTKPTFWSLVRGAAINLLLPFVNGMMLGLGELLAHEIAFRWGWGTMQIFPKHRSSSSTTRTVGPGIEVRDDPSERQRRKDQRGAGMDAGLESELMDTAALE